MSILKTAWNQDIQSNTLFSTDNGGPSAGRRQSADESRGVKFVMMGL